MQNNDKKYRYFFENSADAMLIIVNGEFVDCNSATLEMLGYDCKAEVINRSPFELSPANQPCGRRSTEKAKDILDIAIERGSCRFEWDHLRKDGTIVPVDVTLTAINNKDETHIHTVWRDISKRKRAELELSESEELFRQTFETNPDPLILARLSDGAVFDVNNAFEVSTGYLREDVIGKNSNEIGVWPEKGQRKEFRGQLIRQGSVTNLESDFVMKDGMIRSALLSAQIINTKGQPCILISLRDITSKKNAERALQEMDQMKSQFISTAAHELRTPLATIIGSAELLLNPASSELLSEERKRFFLTEIIERGEALERLISDFLDVSRIENGLPLPLDRQEHDLIDLLVKTVQLFQLREEKYLFEIELPEQVGNSLIKIDRQRVRQVLENLLGNAVKYSHEGTMIMLRAEEMQGGWRITIEDQGIGMSKEELARVFNRYYRANASDPTVEGLGLGMSIVKSIVDEHGGQIHAESVQGHGSKIIFTLPG